VVVEIVFPYFGCRHVDALVLYNLSLKTTAENNGTIFNKVNIATFKLRLVAGKEIEGLLL
jgi:hypothetical protein